jgi:hypothetical protein
MSGTQYTTGRGKIQAIPLKNAHFLAMLLAYLYFSPTKPLSYRMAQRALRVSIFFSQRLAM